jgi:hypothetical protein
MTIINGGAPATTALDPAKALSWLRILHGDAAGLTHICSTGDWTGRTFADVDAALRYITYLDGEGREGIYARVTTISTPLDLGRRGSAADSAALPALWADIDIDGPGHEHQVCPAGCDKPHTHITRPLPPDVNTCRLIVALSGLPDPTIWIHSGGGVYPIWLLTAPHAITDDNLGDARTLAAGWQRAIEHAAIQLGWHYGRGVGDLSRVLRIPGTVNRKAGLARPCQIINATTNRYRYLDLEVALAKALTAIAPPAPPEPTRAPMTAVDRPAGAISPGDDYAARTSWNTILEGAGWKLHYTEDDITYWTRPGKPTGISASTNALGTDRLHVFTTSAPPLQGDESYSKMGAYAELYHGGDHSAAAGALAELGYGTPLPDPAVADREQLEAILGHAIPEPPPPPAGPTTATPGPSASRPPVDVTNAQEAADWLRDSIGRGRLAGYFDRGDQIVHTPREGEEGYRPLTRDEVDDDGPAQVRPISDSQLAARISFTHYCYKMVKRGDDSVPQPNLFPRAAARAAVDVPDMMPHLRPLRGVVHSPVIRADGTVLEAPGYDPATAQLHLPEPGLIVPRVPEHPTSVQLAQAVALLERMVAGFTFVSDDDKANYIGVLLTPLIRALAPPPYQLAAITAPQPGSGKTLLANCARIIHGGVFRAEMPAQDDELRKQITTILDYTTGALVHFDNVSGTVRSSIVAGLLTSAVWDDRRLGVNELVHARNDRLWIITGNNLSLGGDLARRTIWITIDPGVPHPERRTGFAIQDLERWTREHRGQLIHALLTLVRAWVSASMPKPELKGSDSYSRWTQTIAGILANAGIAGTFGEAQSASRDIGTDDEEWHDFLVAVHSHFGTQPWTVRQLLSNLDTGQLISSGGISLDALPAELAEKASKPAVGVMGIAKSLGRWLRNRDGRWAGPITVRADGLDRTKTGLWRIEEAASSTPAGQVDEVEVTS